MEVKEYLPIEGDKDFLMHAMKFAYGKDMDIENHVAAVQTLSGTGACAIGGHFLHQFWPDRPIYVPDPTWGNHIAIFKQCGLEVRQYRYYDRKNKKLDIDGMIQDLSRATDGSIVVLHACAHNPTGCDPSLEEWKELISVISNKSHIAFFDAAYLGFASGNAEADVRRRGRQRRCDGRAQHRQRTDGATHGAEDVRAAAHAHEHIEAPTGAAPSAFC